MVSPEKLLILLNGTNRLFIQYANKVLSDSGCPVGYLQFVALKAIGEIKVGSVLSIKKIADSIGIERSTLSHNSDILQRDGYIIKISQRPGFTTLCLTDLGKTVVFRWEKTYQDITKNSVCGVSDKFGDDLERIGRNLL